MPTTKHLAKRPKHDTIGGDTERTSVSTRSLPIAGSVLKYPKPDKGILFYGGQRREGNPGGTWMSSPLWRDTPVASVACHLPPISSLRARQPSAPPFPFARSSRRCTDRQQTKPEASHSHAGWRPSGPASSQLNIRNETSPHTRGHIPDKSISTYRA